MAPPAPTAATIALPPQDLFPYPAMWRRSSTAPRDQGTTLKMDIFGLVQIKMITMVLRLRSWGPSARIPEVVVRRI